MRYSTLIQTSIITTHLGLPKIDIFQVCVRFGSVKIQLGLELVSSLGGIYLVLQAWQVSEGVFQFVEFDFEFKWDGVCHFDRGMLSSQTC